MADWIDELVGKTKGKYEEQRIQDKKFLIEQEQKLEAGKRFMERFRAHLEKAVNEFNAKIGDRIVGIEDRGDSLTVRATLTRQDAKIVDVEYSPALFNVRISKLHSGLADSYQLVIVGGIAMLEMDLGVNAPPVQLSAEKLVQFVLGRLLNG